MSDTIVIDGEVELLNVIDGDPDVCIGGGSSQPTGTKSILLTEAGTKTEDVTAYASAEINAVKSATASGAVASFSDGAEDVPMTSCVVSIEPVQSGSGYPSPSNVRPISGWSEVNVVVSPTNDAQDGTTYPVSLGQTVYGGTLDVVSGVLTVDRAMVDMGTLTWASFSANGRTAFRAIGQIDGVPIGGATGKANALCTQYNVVQNSYIGNTSYDNVIAVGAYWSGGCNVYIYDSAKTSMTGAQFKTAMNGVQLVYELATPTTAQLTPTEVTTLLGSNNVWADSGSISVGYKADVYLTEGGVTPTGTKSISITSNGTTTEDVTNYASASITTNVPASAVDTGTKSISSNGTHDVIGYASASVAVPNSYSASDEGKVVSNGALVAQTSDTVTANDTYDTTLINSLTVNVSGGGGGATVIDTVSFSGVRSVKIDIDATWFNTYDVVYIELSETMSVSDWLYATWNGTSGGNYGNKTTSDTLKAVFTKPTSGSVCGMLAPNRSGQASSNSNVSYLYAYAYTDSTTMQGSYTIWGVSV